MISNGDDPMANPSATLPSPGIENSVNEAQSSDIGVGQLGTPTADRTHSTQLELAVLKHQWSNARKNLMLVEEREAEYVMSTDVPLTLIKTKRRWQERTAQLEGHILAVCRELVMNSQEDELRALCSNLTVDYDDLQGEDDSDRAEALIAHLEREGRLRDVASITPDLPLDALGNAAGFPGTYVSGDVVTEGGDSVGNVFREAFNWLRNTLKTLSVLVLAGMGF
jgi:hypothetical protein